MTHSPRIFSLLSCCLILLLSACGGGKPFPPPDNGDIVIVGNTFADRMQHYGYFETLIQKSFPGKRLHLRNRGWSADEPGLQPRPLNFNELDTLNLKKEADVLIACFGMNEAFDGPDSLDVFRTRMNAYLDETLQTWAKDGRPPQLVLVSPIAHEDLGGKLPDPARHNENLRIYTEALADLADKRQATFIDLFTPTLAAFQANEGTPYTINGIHLNDRGYRLAARLMAEALELPAAAQANDRFFADNAPLRELILEKNRQFFHRWRAVNGEYIYGRRKEPFGVHNFPSELRNLDQLVADLEEAIFDAADPEPRYVHPYEIVGEPGVPYQLAAATDGSLTPSLDDRISTDRFTLPPGYQIELVASEDDFPIDNPVSITFDAKGRLWVITMPTYPHYLPGYPPNDKVIILEDEDQDGRMDKHTVFADGLYLPTGFELGDGGAYVAQQPNLVFLMDTDGDDRADSSEIVLHGFGTEDSHHSISAFTWGPDGALYMHEGTFHHSQVETPHGPRRVHYAATFRYHPRNEKLDIYVSYPYANPWGQVFDKWGVHYIADASGGANYYGPPLTGAIDYPRKRNRMRVFTSIVRPTAGAEIISSRHFPPSVQGNFLINNNIGFQGTKQHQVFEEGSGVSSREIVNMLQSSDPNFRPVDIHTGPDGALYIVDWYNPLIGHMQFSVRDPGRDHSHGRIWRITYPGRPKLPVTDLTTYAIPELLEELKAYEDRQRYRARRELRDRPEAEVLPELARWTAGLDPRQPDYEHHLLEGLWMYQQLDLVEEDLLRQLLDADKFQARAAAVRVLRYWRDRVPGAFGLLTEAVRDPSPRVRLEALTALSFFPTLEAVETSLEVLDQEMDYYLDYALDESMLHLAKVWKPALRQQPEWLANRQEALSFLLERSSAEELMALPNRPEVLRERILHEGMEQQARIEAAIELGRQEGQSSLRAIASLLLQNEGLEENPGLGPDVLATLTSLSDEQLQEDAGLLEDLIAKAQTTGLRQYAMAALLRADRSGAETLALGSGDRLADFLRAIPLLPEAADRNALYTKVKAWATNLPDPIQREQAARSTVEGRYVRVLPLGTYSRVPELEVYAGHRNLARTAVPSQSSSAQGSSPLQGIDGNPNSDAVARADAPEQWFEVDLGVERTINRIVLRNNSPYRQDPIRLQAFRVEVLDANRQRQWSGVHRKSPADQVVVFDVSTNLTDFLQGEAVRVMAAMPGYRADQQQWVPDKWLNSPYRVEALEAMRAFAPEDWLKPVAGKLVEPLAGRLADLKGYLRESSLFDQRQALADSLRRVLPQTETAPLDFASAAGAIARIEISTVPGEMKYDTETFSVQAGQRVEITFRNPDVMQHNLIIVNPGQLEPMGALADELAQSKDGIARQYIPDSPEVLFSTRLLNANETYTLTFIAPDKPGDYPFLCTYPGHWRLMNGRMKVTAPTEETL